MFPSSTRLAKPSFGFLQCRLFRSAVPVSMPGTRKAAMPATRQTRNIPSVRLACRCMSSNSPSPSSSSSPLENRPAIGDPTVSSLSAVLQEQVALGNLRSDKAQQKVAKRLSRLQQALVGYDNEILFRPPVVVKEDNKNNNKNKNEMENDNDSGEESKKTASAHDTSTNNDDDKSSLPPTPTSLRIPRGLYIHGSVGTGKSMLMDTFFEHAPVEKKARYHFHSFLAQVHQQIHQLKQQDLKEKGRNFSIDTSVENNPIHRVALQLSQSISLLCLDEFQVTDIADAVILSQLFSVLFVKGTVVVATSNRPPQDLYEGGLNRSYFLPFLDLLEKHCIVHAIESDVDYRRTLASCSSFFGRVDTLVPVMEEVIETVVGADSMAESSSTAIDLPVGFQRTFRIDHAYETSGSTSPEMSRPLRACRLNFLKVCDADVGALDYRAIANQFDIVCLEHVQVMDLEGHNRARRFITLIDELYEAKCCLLLSTDAELGTPLDLFHVSRSQQSSLDSSSQDPGNPLGIDVATQGGMAVGALASVRELAFAFERASSRIVEMCSRSWWEKRLPAGSESAS